MRHPRAQPYGLMHTILTAETETHRGAHPRLGIEGDWNAPYLTMNFEAEAVIASELMKFATSGQLSVGGGPSKRSIRAIHAPGAHGAGDADRHHGGPHGLVNEDWHWRWNTQAFAAGGYVVASVNFHGSTSWGEDFTGSIRGAWGDKPYRDIMAATEKDPMGIPHADPTAEPVPVADDSLIGVPRAVGGDVHRLDAVALQEARPRLAVGRGADVGTHAPAKVQLDPAAAGGSRAAREREGPKLERLELLERSVGCFFVFESCYDQLYRYFTHFNAPYLN